MFDQIQSTKRTLCSCLCSNHCTLYILALSGGQTVFFMMSPFLFGVTMFFFWYHIFFLSATMFLSNGTMFPFPVPPYILRTTMLFQEPPCFLSPCFLSVTMVRVKSFVPAVSPEDNRRCTISHQLSLQFPCTHRFICIIMRAGMHNCIHTYKCRKI